MRRVRFSFMPARAPGRVARRPRRARVIGGACLLAVLALTTARLPVAATSATQGSITISGEGSASPYPCTFGCQPTFGITTTGYMAGTDGSGVPFAATWGGAPVSTTVPAASMILSIANTCITGTVTASLTQVSGYVTVNSVALVYGGVTFPATLSAQFNTQVAADDVTAVAITGVELTLQVGATVILQFPASAKGVLNFTPLGQNVCVLGPTSPMPFSIDGTMASWSASL